MQSKVFTHGQVSVGDRATLPDVPNHNRLLIKALSGDITIYGPLGGNGFTLLEGEQFAFYVPNTNLLEVESDDDDARLVFAGVYNNAEIEQYKRFYAFTVNDDALTPLPDLDASVGVWILSHSDDVQVGNNTGAIPIVADEDLFIELVNARLLSVKGHASVVVA
ncbi:MAG TPA: hypothetical protein VGN12_16905 [Pirellulales bacterium]|jgi:hypothetical protein